MKKKIFGWFIIVFAISGFVLVLGGRIYYHETRNFNAAPFIFATVFLVGWGITLIKGNTI